MAGEQENVSGPVDAVRALVNLFFVNAELKAAAKMSDTMLLVAERDAWREIENQMRHSLAPQPTASDKAAAYSKVRASRGLSALPVA